MALRLIGLLWAAVVGCCSLLAGQMLIRVWANVTGMVKACGTLYTLHLMR